MASTSRFAHLWAHENPVDLLPDISNSSPPCAPESNHFMSDGCWNTPLPTSSVFSSDPHGLSGMSEGINAPAQLTDSDYGNRFNGMEVPLSSTPFPFAVENECGPSRGVSASSIASTLNEISALLNDSSIDSSFLSNNSIWSPIPPGCQNNSVNNSYITPKQAIQCLQLIQDFQETANLNNMTWDVGQRVQVNALTSLLQQHLFGVLLSPSSPVVTPTQSINNDNSLERTARFHREVAGLSDATFTWSGQLPPRNHRNPVYSCKVFLGGVPWDITELGLIHAFRSFGNVKIEWPGKEGGPSQPKGYVYIVFENEKQVKALLQNCTHDYSKGGNWYFKISSKKMRAKDVQVIPWALCDSNYVRCQTTKLDPQKTIFVGALHGMLNAEGLATIIQDLFNGVVYAGIDTDRHKYPIGSGRVTFNNHKSYMKAVAAAFVEIRTSKFTKKVQVDPYLEDATCSKCGLQQGPYFCRDMSCFKYFCKTCFQFHHSGEAFRSHRPLMRNSNKPQGSPCSIMPGPFNISNTTGQGNGYGSVGIGRNFYGMASSNAFNNGYRGPSRFTRY